MKTHLRWMLIATAMISPLGRSYAQEAPPRPIELKALDQIAGTWDTVVVFKPSVWMPEERTVKGSVKSEWILDGRFLREQGRSLDTNIEHTATWTYDVKQKAYRCWYFDSTGITNEWKGQWNDAKKTFTYQSDLGEGLSASDECRIVDQDHYEIHILCKDGAGKIYMDMRAVHTRRK